jgi:NADP-dependent 3-hydroxy acid dehydrogenase YdfG
MMTDLTVFAGKVVVVTGAASGIGRAFAQQLATLGAELALSDINEQGLQETVALLPTGTKVSQHVFDVGDRPAYQAYTKQVIQKHHHVDVVINNAGIVRLHSLEASEYRDYDTSINVNIMGVLHGCKEFIPYLKQRPEAWLVNISSVAGLIGVPNYSSYNMTKFAVRGLTESLRNELAGTGIHVSCIHPGGVSTNIQTSSACTEDARRSSEKLAEVVSKRSAEDAVNTMLKGIARGKKRILIGSEAYLVDFLARIMPVGYDRIVSRLF